MEVRNYKAITAEARPGEAKFFVTRYEGIAVPLTLAIREGLTNRVTVHEFDFQSKIEAETILGTRELRRFKVFRFSIEDPVRGKYDETNAPVDFSPNVGPYW